MTQPTITIKIDLLKEILSLPDKERADLYDRLSCEDEIIKSVGDQLIAGCTQYGSCGSTHGVVDIYTYQWPSALEIVARKMLDFMPEIAAKEIKNLASAAQGIRENYAADRQKWYDAERLLRRQYTEVLDDLGREKSRADSLSQILHEQQKKEKEVVLQ